MITPIGRIHRKELSNAAGAWFRPPKSSKSTDMIDELKVSLEEAETLHERNFEVEALQQPELKLDYSPRI